MRDEDGYFWYKGWSEDLIKSSGFRIGPAEVEECLIAHPSLAIAVIAKPNAERGSIVKAVVKIRAGVVGDDASLYALESAHSARLGSGPIDFRCAGWLHDSKNDRWACPIFSGRPTPGWRVLSLSFPNPTGKPRVDDRRVSSGIVFICRNGLS